MNDRKLTAVLAVGAVVSLIAVVGSTSSFLVAHRVDRFAHRTDRNAASVAQLDRDRRAAIRANLAARFDDCKSQNETRRALRQIARQNERGLSVSRKLFPNIPDRLFRRAERQFRSQLKAFRPRDCARYSAEAKPLP